MPTPPWAEGLLVDETVLDELDRSLSQPHHAWLFVGARGAGKLTTARRWAAALLCDRLGMATPCAPRQPDRCQSCRLTDNGNHPDLHFYLPLGGRKGVSIEQISPSSSTGSKLVDGPQDTLKGRAQLAPLRGRLQVHVVRIDGMSIPAINSMLVVLEEPPGPSVIILLGSALSDILPTVVSRCRRVTFGPVPDARIRSWLDADNVGESPLRPRAVRVSAGRPGVAHALAQPHSKRKDGQPGPPGDEWRDIARPWLLERDPVRRIAALEAIRTWPDKCEVKAPQDVLEVHLRLVDTMIDRVAEAWWWARTGQVPRSDDAADCGPVIEACGGADGVMERLSLLLEVRRRLEAGVQAPNAWMAGAHGLARLA